MLGTVWLSMALNGAVTKPCLAGRTGAVLGTCREGGACGQDGGKHQMGVVALIQNGNNDIDSKDDDGEDLMRKDDTTTTGLDAVMTIRYEYLLLIPLLKRRTRPPSLRLFE